MAVTGVLISIGVISLFYALIALGLNIKYGDTGLIDFGHVAFFLVGAYTAALFTLPPDMPGDFQKYLIGLDLPWVVGALAAMLLAGVVGAFVALPTLRLREDYLAITLLGVSVIFLRIVQVESWLVNGPDALRGIKQPLVGVFPVAGQSVAGAVASLFIAAGLWAGAAYVLGRTVEKSPDERPSEEMLAERLYTITTLGIGRLLRMQNASNPAPRNRVLAAVPYFGDRGTGSTAKSGPSYDRSSALLAGVVVGIVSCLLTLYTTVGLLAWGTVISVLTWLVLIVGVNRYTAEFGAVDYLITLALGTAYMLSLAPVYLLESDVVGIPLTLLAIAAVIGATIYLRRHWPLFSHRSFKYGALTGLWFGTVWYVPLQILSAIQRGAFQAAATRVFHNVVWVLSVSGPQPVIDYSRFLLFMFGAVTFGAIYVSNLIADSPFGRVLKAIRNDEQVVNSLGKDPFMFKVQSMAVGSAFAGLAGALAAVYYQTLVFTMFRPVVTFIAFLIIFLGGVANHRGMIVGAFIFWAIQIGTVQLTGFVDPSLASRVQAFRLVLMGLIFLLILYYRPQGLLGKRSPTEVSDE